MRLLKFVGHVNPSNRKRIPYSYIFSFRNFRQTGRACGPPFIRANPRTRLKN
jgi:hypothetical protein